MTYLLAMFGYKPSKTISLCEVIMQIWWILLRIDVKFMIDFGPGQTKKKKKNVGIILVMVIKSLKGLM